MTSRQEIPGSSAKPIVLIAVGSYLPGYLAGGPIRSIANTVEALGDEFEFRIVTSDRDLGATASYPGIQPGKWTRVGKALVLYLPPGLRALPTLLRALRCADGGVLYLNSLFARTYSMFPALCRRLGLIRPQTLMVAPRGELSPGALKFKSGRKSAFIDAAKRVGIFHHVLWHASTPYEAADIQSVFGRVGAGAATDASEVEDDASEIAIAAPLPTPTPPENATRRPKRAGELRAVFLSRVARKKNLAGALAMLAGLSGRVSFTIFGPLEDREYWAECQAIASKLPGNVRAEHAGEVPHDSVRRRLKEHDVLLFPTQGENYGHVIMEALLAGCPVILSDQTPWRGLREKGAGWDLPLSQPDRFRAALQECIDMNEEEFAESSRRAREFGIARSTDPAVLQQNRDLFVTAIRRGRKALPRGLATH